MKGFADEWIVRGEFEKCLAGDAYKTKFEGDLSHAFVPDFLFGVLHVGGVGEAEELRFGIVAMALGEVDDSALLADVAEAAWAEAKDCGERDDEAAAEKCGEAAVFVRENVEVAQGERYENSSGRSGDADDEFQRQRPEVLADFEIAPGGEDVADFLERREEKIDSGWNGLAEVVCDGVGRLPGSVHNPAE